MLPPFTTKNSIHSLFVVEMKFLVLAGGYGIRPYGCRFWIYPVGTGVLDCPFTTEIAIQSLFVVEIKFLVLAGDP